VIVRWTGFAAGSDQMSPDGNFYGQVGPIDFPGQSNDGGTLGIVVTATDSEGASSSVRGSAVTVASCRLDIVG
jgi:hypothetical protein